MTQLEKDLERAIDDKLHRWMKDSFDLFVMAELPKAGAIAVIHCLMRAMASGMKSFDMTDADCHETFQGYLDRATQSRDRVRSQ